MLKITITDRTLHFKQPAGTSRGVYLTRHSYYLTLTDSERPGLTGVGECAPLPRLSCDDLPDYSKVLREMCNLVEQSGAIPYERLRPYPSMLFGLETAFAQFEAQGSTGLFDTPFARGEEGIPINGLVWMGTFDEMMGRLEAKLEEGFRCVKLKIGAIDFDRELALIRHIRRCFTKEEVELRVDANGGFTPQEAMGRLEALSRFDIHSIEQPIRQHQWAEMARLCAHSPLPIALDEELIGVNSKEEKERLLDTIRPQYIILKPSLHGGMRGSEEWIRLARRRGIGSWITSALESNVGLNAIAHFCAKVYGPAITMAQGLGTGQLFTDNIEMPLEIRGDKLWAGATLASFMSEWRDNSPTVTVRTSGSTGQPKAMRVEKRRMLASARITCDFLGLRPGCTALLCMKLDYIAGKMMVVRGLERGMRLISVPPDGHPLATLGEGQAPDFAAMVPLQVYNSLNVEKERRLLGQIGHLIIGGGAIDDDLERRLKRLPNAVWSSYGMTETLSHIALRRVSGPQSSSWYTPFDNVSVALNEEGCLVITAPEVCDGPLVTNDRAELRTTDGPDGRPLTQFRILGRKDNVIDSGGIKIQIEEVEQALRPFLRHPFMITKRPDAKFGEAIVLLTEHSDMAEVSEICVNCLPKYWVPRHYVHVERLPLTPTGKPARKEAERLAGESVGRV